MILVLHANWTRNALHLWAEAPSAASSEAAEGAAGPAPAPFAAPAHTLERLREIGALSEAVASASQPSSIRILLPSDDQGPWPSDHFRLLIGGAEPLTEPRLEKHEIATLELPPAAALEALLALETIGHDGVDLSPSVRFFMRIARLALELLEAQRFIPTVMQVRGDGLSGAWHPWVSDEETRHALSALLAGMPPVVRAVVDDRHGQPWPIVESALGAMTDAFVRQTLASDSFIDAIDGRDPADDAHVAWLGGLLGERAQVGAGATQAVDLLRDASAWVGRLADVGQGRALQLLLKLHEPALGLETMPPATGKKPKATSKKPPADETTWTLTLHLQSKEEPHIVYDAASIWSGGGADRGRASAAGERMEEVLLAELGRISGIWPRLEDVLAHSAPTHIDLNTVDAYEFLRDIRPLLEESGVSVIVPAWWNQPVGRLGARLQIDAPPTEAMLAAGGTSPAASMLGLNSLVDYRWQIAIGDQPLSIEEFDAIARQAAPLVRVRGRWIEINPQQLKEARDFILKSPTGQMTLLEAIQTAHGASASFGSELPVFGMDATGWVNDVLSASTDDRVMPHLAQPATFIGDLRPYQKSGLSWLSFLDQYGLGACLADDMGLGKTIQFIALLLHERGVAADAQLTTDDAQQATTGADKRQSKVGPTLLIVPTSVVANWVRELERFAPTLKPHVHHGPDRVMGDRFVEIASQRDLIITTYPLAARDHETLRRVHWHRVTLDEAQYIKNPPTKQTAAIRALVADRRLALTGTPVENRLSELWSIMEFLNPGYLGPGGEFRRRFAIPIERHRNARLAERLRHMVRPFILRRVKTDPNVIDDLPPCLETKEYATLTAEQAALYQQVVNSMLGEVDRAAGIQRRGLVLATLVKLKQICNHPAQFLNAGSNGKIDWVAMAGGETTGNGHGNGDADAAAAPALLPALAGDNHLFARSGKSRRLLTMLEEVLASGEKALVFTQFRQMGHILAAIIQRELEVEPLFMHGGTPANKRQHLVDRFQNPHGGAPVFILSLKAGGVGLNLTAASHVFHFDRWWNPAVENQATDRAFRIGQTRRVHVHKFVCLGTLEERIDQMIEQKTELAKNIIGSGEAWLTEFSTSQLRDLLMLRTSAMEGDA